MAWKITTPPAAEPISLTEAKSYLRLDHATEDALVTSLITAARQLVEQYTRLALVTQVVTESLDKFPIWTIENLDAIYLSVNPVQTIDSLTYIDQNGESQTLGATDYELDSTSEPARLTSSLDAQFWPGTLLAANAVTIVYTAGYGAAAAVPQGIIAGLYLTLGHLYSNRDAKGTNMAQLPYPVQALLNPFKVAR